MAKISGWLGVLCLVCFGKLSYGKVAAWSVQDVLRAVNEIEPLQTNAQNAFSWSSCGTDSDPLKINSLSVSPDPIPIGKNVSISFDGDVKTTLEGPIELSLHIDKKVLFWVEIPCIDNVGSCTYPDLCAMMNQIQCPQVFLTHHILCQCPFKSGHYALPTSMVDLNVSGIPSWLEKGEYKVKVTLSKSGQQLSCWQFQFSLTT